MTGTADTAVTVDNPLLYDAACMYRADWNARLCPHGYTALLVDDRSDTSTSLGPIVVRRDDGATHTVIGRPDDGPNDHFRTSVLNGRSYTIDATGAWTRTIRSARTR